MMTRRAALAALLPALAHSAEKPEALVWTPESIRWQTEEYGGAKYSVIDGDRDQPGQPFTYAFWMPAGLWVPAHRHSQQAHVAVMQGALLLGFGEKLEQSKARRIAARQFFIVRAGVAHFEGCAEETLIIGTGLGGWRTTLLQEK
jgi:hypothetical protein